MEIQKGNNDSKFSQSRHESSSRVENVQVFNIAEELYQQIDLAEKIEFLLLIMTRNCLDADQAEICMKNKKKNGWKLLIED